MNIRSDTDVSGVSIESNNSTTNGSDENIDPNVGRASAELNDRPADAEIEDKQRSRPPDVSKEMKVLVDQLAVDSLTLQPSQILKQVMATMNGRYGT